MNKTKRNLILSAAIINLINMVANLVVAIIYCVNPEYYFETLLPAFFLSIQLERRVSISEPLKNIILPGL